MDVLGGYGSDSSSEEEISKIAETKTKNSLSELIGADSGSDTDDSDSKNSEGAIRIKSIRTSSLPPVKRQKVETKQISKSSLPKPPTTSRSGPSMIRWDIDYLEQNEESSSAISEDSIELSKKLERLAATLNGSSYADHLKTQKEFHNPHFNESMVEHFGIRNILGSQAMYSNNEVPQDKN